MDPQTYIDTGILELYVAGALTEQENREVYDMMVKHPEVLQEVLEIENAVVKLTASVAPKRRANLFPLIKERLNSGSSLGNNADSKVVRLDRPRYNWVTWTGWAAAILFGAGLLWLLNTNNELEGRISNTENQNEQLESQIEEARESIEANEELLATIRDRDVIEVPLAGQTNFENTYAKVYWDKDENKILLDAQGLPEPPQGKVYQVWSLKLSPLTPTSLGTIDTFIEDDNKIFTIENANESEAFGITLEPAGGSEAPTMEQLYTLGAVETEAGP